MVKGFPAEQENLQNRKKYKESQKRYKSVTAVVINFVLSY